MITAFMVIIKVKVNMEFQIPKFIFDLKYMIWFFSYCFPIVLKPKTYIAIAIHIYLATDPLIQPTAGPTRT